ncbi:hypothetical protein BDZ45DRAFT_45560 [Acephala macrosclerotiorum]|nr:hypothetical protein BDZ45DRAFT_45560 [Acephala macrosclerotiorum]
MEAPDTWAIWLKGHTRRWWPENYDKSKKQWEDTYVGKKRRSPCDKWARLLVGDPWGGVLKFPPYPRVPYKAKIY